MRQISRRDFLASGLVVLGAVAAGPGLLRRALSAPRVTEGLYGPLAPPDANGIRLPEGFSSREIARSGRRVADSDFVWHDFPDGGATFAVASGGWIYVSNSETGRDGGAGAVRFDDRGEIADAYRILDGTSTNCAGGPTPWGTWLSCEEHDRGRVWECDPTGESDGVARPALGVFKHESACVDPVHRRVYLTEDTPDGLFYRFTPARYPDLSEGVLECAVGRGGKTRWVEVPDPSAGSTATRLQVPDAQRFDGGEGTWYDDGIVYFTTKGDNRVWTHDTRTDATTIFYEARNVPGAPLSGVDNITVAVASGDILVAEDGGDLDIVMITPEGEIARLLKMTGGPHRTSEIAGPAMDPSGTRLYFSSQRGFERGTTYEVTGPFRTTRTMRGLAVPTPPIAAAPPDDGVPGSAIAAGAAVAAAGAAAFTAYRRRARREDPPRGD